MLRTLLIFIAAYSSVALVKAQDFPCVNAAKGPAMMTAFPDYINEIGVKQPASHQILQQCLTQYRVCLLLNNGTVVKAQRSSDIKIKSRQISFGLIQTHKDQSRSYCTIGSLLSNEGESFWSYLTFSPNGDGGIAEGLDEKSDDYKTSAELFVMLERNFRHSIHEIRKNVASGEVDLKQLGYRDGEKP